ncbi:MAG: hypothetical protein JO362_13480 [Streptomycetaceae bacterium]|nr:hypothetical protein [Streptomycetaceae bacterium]
MFRHWRRVALGALVGAGTYGLATAGLAGAASAHPSVQLRVCNDASVTQTFHIDGTNQYGHTAQWRDRQIGPHSCMTTANWWWATGKIAVVHHRSSAHPSWATDNHMIWSDTPNGITVSAHMRVNGYMDGYVCLEGQRDGSGCGTSDLNAVG